jgi:hypothetical protein
VWVCFQLVGLLVPLSLLALGCSGGSLQAKDPSPPQLIMVNGKGYISLDEALSAIPATGGTVRIPPGIWNFSVSHEITIHNVTIEGDGSVARRRINDSLAGTGATVLRWTGGASVPLTISSLNTTLRNFNLDNVGTGTIGILNNGAFHTLLDNVAIAPSKPFLQAGFATAEDKLSAFIQLRHCFFWEAAPVGVDIDNANLVTLEGATFLFNDTNVRVGHTRPVFGFYFLGGADSELTGLNGHLGVDLDLEDVTNAVVRDSYFEADGEGFAGGEKQLVIKVGEKSKMTLIEGNYFQGNSHTNYAIESGGALTFVRNNVLNGLIDAGVIGKAKVEDNALMGITPLEHKN